MLNLVSAKLAESLGEKDDVPLMLTDREGKWIASIQKVNNDIVQLQTHPITIANVPTMERDLQYIETHIFSQLSQGLNALYREYMPDAIRLSHARSGMSRFEDEVSKFLKKELLHNTELHDAIRARGENPPPPSGSQLGGR